VLGQNPNQFVILPIVILIQSIEGALSEHFRRNLRYLDDFRKITAGSVENAYDRSATVIAALENGIGERHEPPHQFQCFGKIGVGYLIDDSAALRFEVLDQCPSILPVNEGSGSRNGRQPFANLLRDLAWVLRARQFQPETLLHGGVAGADLDQQLGQTLGPERLKVR
jgi:hypothetical protein